MRASRNRWDRTILVLCSGWLLSGGLAAVTWAGEKIDPSQGTADPEKSLVWYDIKLLGVEGQGWTELKSPFDRLPAKAEGVVRPPVWSLSQQSAGLCVRFITDATTIQARWTLTSTNLAMPHMPATGVSGLDLYVRHEGKWHWLGVGQPRTAPDVEATLTSGIPAGTREFLLYLPLYNGVKKVEIGISKDSFLSTADARPESRRKPVLFYGTSITQGGCASRPGMVHTALLGRWLERPVLNLGFSGNGRMEPELADLLAELDPAVFVLDCLPNMGADEVRERVVPFVKRLRQSRPDTPILLVEDRTYSNAFLVTGSRSRNDSSRKELRIAYDKLKADGVTGLTYLEGENLLGPDNEGTVDSSHPTDLGFVRQAEAMLVPLKAILAE